MKNREFIFLTAFLIAPGILHQAKSQVSGTWSGTISEHSWFGGHPGVVAEMISNISYSRNVGTATYNESGSITADGKVISRTSCSGSGTVGFSTIRIDAVNNVYTIQSSALVYYCTYLGAEPDSGELFITIDSVWNGNPRVLKGSKTLVTDNGGGGKLTTITTWNLVKDSETELIVSPQKYDVWLPIPGRDEQTPGPEMMTVKLELKDRNGRPASEKAESFVLRLNNTSKEKGITINMPLVPAAQQLPDLRFQPQANAVITDEGQVMTLYCPTGCLTADIRIACYDGGAWTTLTALAKLETDSIKGKLLNPQGEENIRIPKRADGSNIATKWLNENGNPGETDDEDEIPGVTNKGDGLSAYEEYRGVICEKEFGAAKFGRLDPRKMNLGLKVDKAELPIFSTGINWFENASKLKVLRFNETEISPDRKLNKNAGHATIYQQYALLLYKGLLGYMGSALGVAYTTRFDPTTGLMQPDIPANTQNIVIDIAEVQYEYNLWANKERPARLPFTQADLLASTVAHELGHGVNIPHHGYQEDEKTPQAATLPDQSPYYTFRVFDRSGNPMALPLPDSLRGRIGIPGGLQSGDLSCLMVYNPYYTWAFTRGADFARIYNKVPLIAIGNKLCTSTNGTGFNHSIIYFGDATTGGNCFEKIKLK